MDSFKKGFAAACQRAEIEDLRPYDLRHTFATRLLERNVQALIISALMGYSTSNSGESRITFGYAHATWKAMCWAVETLEHAPQFDVSRWESSKSRANDEQKDSLREQAKVG